MGVRALLLLLLCVLRQSILDVCGQVPPEAIKDLVGACKSGQYSRVQQQVSSTAHMPGRQQRALDLQELGSMCRRQASPQKAVA